MLFNSSSGMKISYFTNKIQLLLVVLIKSLIFMFIRNSGRFFSRRTTQIFNLVLKFYDILIFSRTGLFTFLTIDDLISTAIPSSHVDDHLWKAFDLKRESPWER